MRWWESSERSKQKQSSCVASMMGEVQEGKKLTTTLKTSLSQLQIEALLAEGRTGPV